MAALHLDIWQFVRVMVLAEEEPDRYAALLRHWGEEWREIDRKLTELSRSDFAAYSAMMMDSQIDLTLPSSALLPELKLALRSLDKQMHQRIIDKASDRVTRRDLAFERGELRQLAERLGFVTMGEKPSGKPRPRP